MPTVPWMTDVALAGVDRDSRHNKRLPPHNADEEHPRMAPFLEARHL
jgi:hypothetical protein